MYVEVAEAEVEHKDPVALVFYILQYAKQRLLKLCYNSFDQVFDISNFEELEMIMVSLYIALVEKELTDFIGYEVKHSRKNCNPLTAMTILQ